MRQAMKQQPNSYWEKRALERMAEYHRSANSTVTVVTKAYDKSIQDIQTEIEKIFKTFGKNGQLDAGQAKKLLNQKIPNPLLVMAKKLYPRIKDKKIQRWLLNRMNTPAYRARITRLEALKENAFLQSKVIADAEITASTFGYMKTIKEAYYRTMFDTHRGLGLGFEFASIPHRVIETILKNPWSGQHFSKRVWHNTDELAQRITKVITGGFMSGTSSKKMVNELQDLSQMGKHAANRLIRTETTYMANAAEVESYKEAEVDQYLFIATLDSRTSPQCRKNDLKVYNVNEAKPGKTLPPLHVFCRSTTRAYFGEDTLEKIHRRARDLVTGKNILIPGNMNYLEWEKQYVKAG
jgi:SPP1 gp7 family putative phage head morphogenesis protein